MMLTPGTRLGTYQVIGALGAGGMGEVYRARDLRLGREVALKVLPAAFSNDAERRARFEREARTVAGLNHPNIVVLHSVEEEDGIHFLTLEMVEGQNLEQLVMPGGLPLRRVLDLGIALTDALAAAHQRNVVHRDLKPANVMVTPEGRVKVLDFGLARSAPPTPDGTSGPGPASLVSTSGAIIGTVPYMAPEQICGEAVDARTDLYSLGVLLYELATGRRPFHGTAWAEVGPSILMETPAPLSSLRGDLPGELDRIVARCLEKTPAARFQSALEVGHELRQLKQAMASPSPAAPSGVVPSIAVLPFVNRSRDEDDEYFSDGLADEILSVLSKIRGLRVAARTSSFYFKGKDVTLAQVGQALHVATVLEGSVRKAGNRVRIAVQLVNVSDGYHLWSETYDRTLEDIFAVQDDIARAVVQELRSTLIGRTPESGAAGELKAELAVAAKGRGTDPEAHRLFLLGRYRLSRFDREGFAAAVAHLQRAVELDPGHALAWAGLSRAHSFGAAWSMESVREGNALAREAARRALALEPGLAEGHVAMGLVQYWHDWDWNGADASFRLARDAAPGNADAVTGAGMLAYSLNRLGEAMALGRLAIERDPLSVTAHHRFGRACAAAGRLPEAVEAFRKALEISPEGMETHCYLALLVNSLGRNSEALAEAMQEPSSGLRLWALATVHHAGGRPAASDEALRELIENHGETSAYQIASIYGARAEADAAFEWLERARQARDAGLVDTMPALALRGLHSDPRWNAFLRRMGLRD